MKISKDELEYPTNNKVLRFIGDCLITFGSWLVYKGLRWGGTTEAYEIEMDFDTDDV